MTAYFLLMPGIPMLFQGQEFAASTPFLYFADHRDDLVEPVRKGRAEFLAQFPSIADPEIAAPPRRPGRPGDIPPLLSSISASASGTRRLTRCIATCSRCAATIRCSGGGRRGSMAR